MRSMEQDKAKISVVSAPGRDPGDLAELLVAGVQDLLGASDDDARRWREKLAETPRRTRDSGTLAAPTQGGRLRT